MGIDIETVIAANKKAPVFRGRQVVYDEREAESSAKRELLKHATQVKDSESARAYAGLAFAVLRMMASHYKNSRFSVEKEYRLIAEDGYTSSGQDKDIWNPTYEKRLPSPVDFYERRGKLIPFVTIHFPVEAIKAIWLGPRFGDELDESALRYFLSRNGVNVQGTIFHSKASYRQ
jgi:hypothetical protein